MILFQVLFFVFISNYLKRYLGLNDTFKFNFPITLEVFDGALSFLSYVYILVVLAWVIYFIFFILYFLYQDNTFEIKISWFSDKVWFSNIINIAQVSAYLLVYSLFKKDFSIKSAIKRFLFILLIVMLNINILKIFIVLLFASFLKYGSLTPIKVLFIRTVYKKKFIMSRSLILQNGFKLKYFLYTWNPKLGSGVYLDPRISKHIKVLMEANSKTTNKIMSLRKSEKFVLMKNKEQVNNIYWLKNQDSAQYDIKTHLSAFDQAEKDLSLVSIIGGPERERYESIRDKAESIRSQSSNKAGSSQFSGGNRVEIKSEVFGESNQSKGAAGVGGFNNKAYIEWKSSAQKKTNNFSEELKCSTQETRYCHVDRGGYNPDAKEFGFLKPFPIHETKDRYVAIGENNEPDDSFNKAIGHPHFKSTNTVEEESKEGAYPEPDLKTIKVHNLTHNIKGAVKHNPNITSALPLEDNIKTAETKRIRGILSQNYQVENETLGLLNDESQLGSTSLSVDDILAARLAQVTQSDDFDEFLKGRPYSDWKEVDESRSSLLKKPEIIEARTKLIGSIKKYIPWDDEKASKFVEIIDYIMFLNSQHDSKILQEGIEVRKGLYEQFSQCFCCTFDLNRAHDFFVNNLKLDFCSELSKVGIDLIDSNFEVIEGDPSGLTQFYGDVLEYGTNIKSYFDDCTLSQFPIEDDEFVADCLSSTSMGLSIGYGALENITTHVLTAHLN